MTAGLIGIVIAAMFASAALYINVAEHPARAALPVQYALDQWQPAYERGFAMQASLAVAGGLALAAQWWLDGGMFWLVSAVLLLGNWPFTLIVIMPVNRRLIAARQAGSYTGVDALLRQWNRLHGMRTLLGFASLVAGLVAAI